MIVPHFPRGSRVWEGRAQAPRRRLCSNESEKQVMGPSISRDAELRVLGDLCRALVKRGLYVQLRDAVPGLTVTRRGGTATDVIGYVVVNRRKGEVSWWRVDNLHPITDLDGAVDLISAFMAESATPDRPRSRP
ncbi:hypothetical protein K8Z49_26730 [Actinomadura madurae]|uniref:hypothetical protein n=1 Tax=Actinomadura madurae TaxID=1993 RepID=UPI00399B8954